MKKLIFMLMIFSYIYQINGQTNNTVILYDNTPGPPTNTWNTSGHIIIPDFIPGNNILVSTEINGINSNVRIQKHLIASPYTQTFDNQINSMYDRETAIAFEADNTGGNFILAGNTLDPNKIASGFLSQVSAGGIPGTTIKINIQDPAGEDYPHTYILDLKVVDNTKSSTLSNTSQYYICGYIADGPNSTTSSKKPFVACYNNTLTFMWVRVIDRAHIDNNFSALEYIPANSTNVSDVILTSGCVIDLFSATRVIPCVAFDLNAGTEINQYTYYTHGAGFGTDADHTRVADILYQEFPSAATPIDPSVVLLTYNDVDQAITLARLDLAPFTVSFSASTFPSTNGNPFPSVGFELMPFDVDGNMAVVGYDYSAPSVGGPTFGSHFTYISLHDPVSLYSYSYDDFVIDNVGYEFLSNDVYYQPLGTVVTAPDAFYPAMAYMDLSNATGNVYIGSTRYKINPPFNLLHHNVKTNFDPLAPSGCALWPITTFNNNSFSPHMVWPIVGGITVTSAEVNIGLTPGFKFRTTTGDGTCPPLTGPGAFKTSGIEELKNKPLVSIFPNPVIDVLNIEMPKAQDFQYAISNSSGILFTLPILQKVEDKISLDMHLIPDGFYFITCTDKNKTHQFTEKIIKQ